MKHALAVAGVLVLAGCTAGGSPPTAAPPATVTIAIDNRSGATLFCTAVLAHFITRDTGPIPSGARVALEFDRPDDRGTLAYGTHNGAPMYVENLLCGREGAWDATRVDIDLRPARSGTAERYALRCTDGEPLACALEPQP
ncbi:MAG: hypothetical protein R3F55_03735 [Alphaproteobacteria bacterium]